MVTDVRQRVAREQLGRRGRKADPAWANRRLLRAGVRPPPRALDRLTRTFVPASDPTGESAQPGGSRNACGCCLPPGTGTPSPTGCTASTRPSWLPTCPLKSPLPAMSFGRELKQSSSVTRGTEDIGFVAGAEIRGREAAPQWHRRRGPAECPTDRLSLGYRPSRPGGTSAGLRTASWAAPRSENLPGRSAAACTTLRSRWAMATGSSACQTLRP